MSEECCGDCDSSEEVEEEETTKYTVQGKAGWVGAKVEADNPKEACEIWERMMDKMLNDVEGLGEGERNRMGLK